MGGPQPGPSGWAQAGPKWVGPSWAQARNLGPKKIQNLKIIKIKIHVAQNVGKVWISRKKILLAPFGAISANFLRGPEKIKKCLKQLPIFLGQRTVGLGRGVFSRGRDGRQIIAVA